MKTLDRYIYRELMVPFLIGTVAVVLMFQANMLIFLFKNFSLQNVPTLAVLDMILYKTPYFLNMTLPVGVALATSLAISRLARESELTAIRASGTAIIRVILPVSIFGLLVGVGNYLLAEKVMPNSEKASTRLSTQMMILATAPDFKANVAIRLADFQATIGSIIKGEHGSLQLSDITLVQTPQPFTSAVYKAKEGSYENGVWTFPHALVWYFKGEDFYQFRPTKLTINQRINLVDFYSQPQPTEMTVDELRQAIKEGKEQHIPATSLEVSYHTRFSVPAACYVFAIFAPVFAIWFGKGGGFVGVLVSILMVMLYWNVFVISTEIFGRNGWINPFLSAWLPNILFAALAVFGLRRLE